MPGDTRLLVDTPVADGGLDSRHDRPALIGFISDSKSEELVREGLTDLATEQLDIRRGGIRAAIATMQKQATP